MREALIALGEDEEDKDEEEDVQVEE